MTFEWQKVNKKNVFNWQKVSRQIQSKNNILALSKVSLSEEPFVSKWRHVKPVVVEPHVTIESQQPKTEVLTSPILELPPNLVELNIIPSTQQQPFKPVPFPRSLLQNVPLLARFAVFDTEWHTYTKDGYWTEGELYCFCLIDNYGHTTRLHLDEFKHDNVRFLQAVLDVLAQYDSLGGYNILDEYYEANSNSFDSDVKRIEYNCKAVNLGEEFVNIKSKIKFVDVSRIYNNRAIKGSLHGIGIDYKEKGLAAVAFANIGESKLEGLSGMDVENLPAGKVIEYCAKDAELCLKLISKNNFEMLEVLYNISNEIKGDFFDVCNAYGPSQWWKSNFKLIGYPKDYPDADWIESRIQKVDGKSTSLFKYEGGEVFDPIPGRYLNAFSFDVQSMYPSMIDIHNLSSETINCACCREDSSALIPQAVMDEVNDGTKGTDRNWSHYWICQKNIDGKLSKIMHELLKKKNEYKAQGLTLRSKSIKILMNALYGLCAQVTFYHYDPRISELATAYARYTINGLAKILGSAVVLGDTDSLFCKNIDKDIDIIAEAKNKFGVSFELDKSWKILFVMNLKKQYFGLTVDGKSENKKLTGLKDDVTKFCNSATQNLIHKKLLELFIDQPEEGFRQALQYTHSVFQELEDRISKGDSNFIMNQLSLTELANKSLNDYAKEDWHKRAYNEILEDCNSDEVLARKKSEGGKEYTYWKISVLYQITTKKGKVSTRSKETTTIHPEKHIQNISIKKYKAELWTAFKPILEVFGLGEKDLMLLKKEL
jgi:hypothetical protein